MSRPHQAALLVVALFLTAGCGSTVGAGDIQAQHNSLGDQPGGLVPSDIAPSVQGWPSGAESGGLLGGQGSPTAPSRSADGIANRGEVARYGPGITRDTINVGFVIAVNGGEANAAVGAAGITTGDERRNDLIVVDELNAHGGIAGRKIVPIFHEVDATTTQTADQLVSAACADFTQDHRAFAVFAGPSLQPCLDRARAVGIQDDVGVSGEDVFRRFPYYAEVSTFNLNRLARAQVRGLVSSDWLTPWNSSLGAPGGPGTKIGIVTLDDASFRSAVSSDLAPGFQRRGFTPSTVFVHQPRSSAELARTGSDMAHAVLRFRQEGIEHVIVFDSGGVLTLLFLNAAQGQRYFPRYGMNTQSAAQYLLTGDNISEEQLRGMLGVGFTPSADLSEADNPDDGVYSNAARRTCMTLFRKHGVTFADGNAKAVALLTCNKVKFLKAALEQGIPYTPGILDRTTFLQGLNHLGQGFQSTMTFGTSFGPAKHDGARSVRLMGFVPSCRCVRYLSAAVLSP